MNDDQYNFSAEEIEKFRINSARSKTYETGLTREDRFLLNVMNMKILEKMEKEMRKNERLDPVLFKKLKMECISREMTMQAMIDSILREKLANE